MATATVMCAPPTVTEQPGPVARKRSRLSEKEPTDLDRHLAANQSDPSHPFKYTSGKVDSKTTRYISLVPRETSKANSIDFGRLPMTGGIFTDHMMRIEHTDGLGWSNAVVDPLAPLQLHPGSKVLHYATEIFEGMKAFRGHDGKIRLFRPRDHIRRFNRSARRACLPTVDVEEFLQCIKQLVALEAHWIPTTSHGYLYIRPAMIGTDFTLGPAAGRTALAFVVCSPGAPCHGGHRSALSLYVNPAYVRAARGTGTAKMGCNYAGTFAVQQLANKQGCRQILWLSDSDQEVTECSGMNIFVLWTNKHGDLELVTPTLKSEQILAGITRKTVLEIIEAEQPAITVSERRLLFSEIQSAIDDNRIIEIFGTGSAVGIAPIESLVVALDNGDHEKLLLPEIPKMALSEYLFGKICDIQYGRTHHKEWVEVVDA